MMKQPPNAVLVGERSYGASGNPQPHALANGVTVFLPSWKAMLPDGAPFETKGIAPDVEVATDADSLARRDAVLEKAIELLKR
jgi:C-terminal processing protease CtpA/Prc